MVSAQWVIAVDWRRRGYFCCGQPGDPLNRIPADLDGIGLYVAGTSGTIYRTSYTPGPPLGNTHVTVSLNGYDGTLHAAYIGLDAGGRDDIPVTAGEHYTLSFWWTGYLTGADTLDVQVFGQDDTLLAGEAFPTPAVGAWARVDLSFSVPAGVTHIYLRLRRANMSGAALSFRLYGLMLTAGARPARGYNDGTWAAAMGDVAPRVTGPVTWNLGCRAYQLLADESALSFTLGNHDRLYSPENAQTPVKDWLGPGAPVAVYVFTEEAGFRMLWRGITDVPQIDPLRFGPRQASFRCTGVKRLLDDSNINLPLLENKRADEIIAAVLPLVADAPIMPELPPLEPGRKVFPQFGDNLLAEPNAPVNAYLVLQDAVEGERGRLFFGRDGKVVFWNRHHLLNGGAPDWTLDNTAQGMGYALGDDYANRVEVTCYPRATAPAAEVLWELEQPMVIPAGWSRTLTVPYTGAAERMRIGATNISQPTDDDFVTDVTGVSITGFEVGAQQVVITLVNSSAQAVTVSQLRIKGQGIRSENPLAVVRAVTPPASWPLVTRYALDLPAIGEPDDAAAIAEFEVARRAVLRGRVPSVTLNAEADGVADAMLIQAEPGHMVRVLDEQTGHDRTYYLVGEAHTLDPHRRTHSVTWELEPAVTNIYWILGKSTLGVDSLPAY